MKRLKYLALVFVFIIQIVHGQNKPERLEWLRDAGFGMFIHWSMDSQLGSVISHSMVGASDSYLQKYIYELPQTFDPEQWEPEHIVKLAKLAGMKYIVFTAKHHNGFCMWDTRTTDFNIMNTPYGKDILAEYIEACHAYHMPVGLYYSPEDFHYLYRNGKKIARRGPGSDPDKDPEYAAFVKSQCEELITQYGKIDVIFIDGEGEEAAREVFWKHQPEVLITRGSGMETPEQYTPNDTLSGVWESCITMDDQWQYKPTNNQYKDGTELIELLVETRAKGGALLLNVGPDPLGTLPLEQETRLREVALWYFINQEAIDSVRPWRVTGEPIPEYDAYIWYLQKKDNGAVYAVISGIPDWKLGDRKEFTLSGVTGTPKSQVEVLGQSSDWLEYHPEADVTTRWSQEADGFHISVVRAQRIYNAKTWPNPMVLKMSHVE